MGGSPRAPPLSIKDELEITYGVEEAALELITLDLLAMLGLVEDAIPDALALPLTVLSANLLN